ncbi:MAG: hydroxymethylbilane synthase [Planctomycetaceae bacterium]|nr:hydroxymethylbilane synthase [Planctomycetaceae bacterium]
MKNLTVKVGTRGSALALAQTKLLLGSLARVHPHVNFVIVPIKTEGDRIKTVAELRKAGKGLFVKEIERALLAGKVSLAIHSMKDLPSEMPRGLILGAVPERVDPRDVFIGKTPAPIDQLPDGARIATSSLRRQAILKSLYPRFEFAEMKGNLDTRLKKLRAPGSRLDGIIVAAAGVRRLYPDGSIPVQPLAAAQVVPAAGQGVLALQIRKDDRAMKKLLAPIHHAPTAACLEAERELQRRLEGGCQVPLGCYAEGSPDGTLTLHACLGSVDGRRILRSSHAGRMDDPLAVAKAVEKALVAAGAREILSALDR